ncbi:MAG: hypothetical protein COS11_01140, partial [bacterium (Candidatus Ratteibacteria) CG01_land_8_20_14_3_00_40_19]
WILLKMGSDFVQQTPFFYKKVEDKGFLLPRRYSLLIRSRPVSLSFTYGSLFIHRMRETWLQILSLIRESGEGWRIRDLNP